MKQRILAIFFVMLLLVNFASCGNSEKSEMKKRKENLKIGLIVSGNEEDPYIATHIGGVDSLTESSDLKAEQIIKKVGVTEDNCYKTAIELVNEGCNLIFAAGSNLEDYIVQAATEKENVQFCVAKGVQAATTDLENLHSYSIAESESRYVSGIVAGMKINDMINNGEIPEGNVKIGYVGSTSNTENTSSYTAFYLGVKSVCQGVSLEVQYSGLENSENLERIAANALIANGCVLIAQHSYTNGAAETCEKNNIYFVGNMKSVTDKAPNFAITSPSTNWNSCYSYAVSCIIKGEKLPVEWSKGYEADSCAITEINENAFASKEKFEETKSKVLEAEKSLKEKKLKVFDTSKWTVDKKTITTTVDEKISNDYYGKEYIDDGCFKEYEISSSPKFGFKIDGITELN